jgi:stage II sporulation protein AA (anti-sigma F factor antagonist)
MVRPNDFEITHTVDGDHLVVAVAGELDMSTVPTLSEKLAAAQAENINLITLDLGRLTFMDSTGVRFLIELDARSRSDGWQLRLLAPSDETAALVLRVTGTDSALPFESRRET